MTNENEENFNSLFSILKDKDEDTVTSTYVDSSSLDIDKALLENNILPVQEIKQENIQENKSYFGKKTLTKQEYKEKQLDVYSDWIKCKDYEEVRKKYGYSNMSGVWKAIQSVQKEHKKKILLTLDDERRRLVEQSYKLINVLWVLAAEGNIKAIDQVVKIQRNISQLLGLDAPEAVSVDAEVIYKVVFQDEVEVKK